MPDTAALPQPHKRKPLTRIQFATLILRQEGKCGCGCGARLVADQIIDEHLNPLDSLGSNELDNRSLYTKACAAQKTEKDREARDKGRRLRGETCTGPSRKLQSRSTFEPSPSREGRVGRKLGHPTLKRTFAGKVVPR